MLKLEQRDQISLVNYIQWKYPGTVTIMSPILKFGGNQAQRAYQGVLMKKMGYVPGTCDLFLPEPRGGKCGLFLELKADKGRVQPEQTQMIARLNAKGYAAVVCYGYAEAVNVLDKYMSSSITTHLE